MKPFRIFTSFLIFTLLIGVFPSISLAVEFDPDFRFNVEFRADWVFVKRDGVYDYQPSVIDDQGWKIWDCGQESKEVGRDAIVLTRIDETGGLAFGPEVVFKSNHGDLSSADSLHACSPTVVKHQHPNVDDGGEYYFMYYECAAKFFNKCDGSENSTNNGSVNCDPNYFDGVFTEICLAISKDGHSWKKYNQEFGFGDERTPVTSIIKVSQPIRDDCGFSYQDLAKTGMYKAYLQYEGCTGDRMGNYGSGQPMAIIKDTSDGKQVWLYYIDTKGEWNKRNIYLVKSYDGVNFGKPIKTNLTNIPSIKTYKKQGKELFVGVVAIYDANYLVYSYDGINWIFPDFDDRWHYYRFTENLSSDEAWEQAALDFEDFKIGMVNQTGMCITPGKPGLMGNKYGQLNSTDDLHVFSGEGKMGSAMENDYLPDCYSEKEVENRGSTWGIYVLKGDLIAKQEIEVKNNNTGSYDGNSVVNSQDFSFLKEVVENPFADISKLYIQEWLKLYKNR
jgi:hypothetical protein